jgi:hypothetical protein
MPSFRSHRATVGGGTGGTAPGRLRRSQTLSTLDNIHRDQENTGIAPRGYNATGELGGEIHSILFLGLMLRRIYIHQEIWGPGQYDPLLVTQTFQPVVHLMAGMNPW